VVFLEGCRGPRAKCLGSFLQKAEPHPLLREPGLWLRVDTRLDGEQDQKAGKIVTDRIARA